MFGQSSLNDVRNQKKIENRKGERRCTIEKHKLTEEERKFLRELQKELNTQDTIGQADPRFWVIKGTEKIFGMEDGEIQEWKS